MLGGLLGHLIDEWAVAPLVESALRRFRIAGRRPWRTLPSTKGGVVLKTGPGIRDAIDALVVLDNLRGAMRVGRARWGCMAYSDGLLPASSLRALVALRSVRRGTAC